jgi:hypothetical protein
MCNNQFQRLSCVYFRYVGTFLGSPQDLKLGVFLVTFYTASVKTLVILYIKRRSLGLKSFKKSLRFEGTLGARKSLYPN